MINTPELWRSTDYVGYDVSNLGNVRSFWKRESLLHRGGGSGTYLGGEPKLLKPQPQSGGYCNVAVARNKKGRPSMVAVHILVAKAFIPNPNNYPHINHLNGIKTDNKATNLEWTLPKLNTAHALRTGLLKVVGEQNPMARLSVDDVVNIRQMRANGVGRKDVAVKFGTTVGYVWAIETGKRWSHIPLAKRC